MLAARGGVQKPALNRGGAAARKFARASSAAARFLTAEAGGGDADARDADGVLWSFAAFRYYVRVFRQMRAEGLGGGADASSASSDGPDAGADAVASVRLNMSAPALRKCAIALGGGRAVARVADFMITAASGGTSSDTTPFLSLVHTDDYHTIVVWERAPLAPEDHSLLRVYLEMALELSRPMCIMGNVCGVRELTPDGDGAADAAETFTEMLLGRLAPTPVVTTDLFLLVHTADVARFMTPRAAKMGMRFYEELLAEGKRFSVVPDKTFAGNPWGVPKN